MGESGVRSLLRKRMIDWISDRGRRLLAGLRKVEETLAASRLTE